MSWKNDHCEPFLGYARHTCDFFRRHRDSLDTVTDIIVFLKAIFQTFQIPLIPVLA